MTIQVNEVPADLSRLVRESGPALRALSEEESLRTRGPGTWTRKEILGHVIDSALNNLHRFIRAQQDESLSFPDYDQPFWVDRGGYLHRPWNELVPLWEHLNIHLSVVMALIPADRLSTPCRIGSGSPVTLGFIVQDYVVHLRHHLNQILDPGGSEGKAHPSRALK